MNSELLPVFSIIYAKRESGVGSRRSGAGRRGDRIDSTRLT